METPMGIATGAVGAGLIVLILVDGFAAMVLPRRVTHPYRPTRLFYRAAWSCWRVMAQRVSHRAWRQTVLSLFGPLSLLALFATWVLGLIVGFGMLHWSFGTVQSAGEEPGLATYVYLSGSTFFTLGYGDVAPVGWVGRVLGVLEAGMGLGFLAVVIAYLPVLFQAFSRREVTISLLDARAGSPPTAAELLRRLGQARSWATLDPFLAEWERWAAELLESQLSFPMLSFYRSQHDNQSWLAALTTIMDTCALLIVGARECNTYQAQLTFAMARHAAVDLALVFKQPPVTPAVDRLPAERLARLRALLGETGLPLRDGQAMDEKLNALRAMYEPFVNALGLYLMFAVPPIVPDKPAVDNWQTSAWTRRTPGIGSLPALREGDEHFG
jgi:hypothetical protein